MRGLHIKKSEIDDQIQAKQTATSLRTPYLLPIINNVC